MGVPCILVVRHLLHLEYLMITSSKIIYPTKVTDMYQNNYKNKTKTRKTIKYKRTTSYECMLNIKMCLHIYNISIFVK